MMIVLTHDWCGYKAGTFLRCEGDQLRDLVKRAIAEEVNDSNGREVIDWQPPGAARPGIIARLTRRKAS